LIILDSFNINVWTAAVILTYGETIYAVKQILNFGEHKTVGI